VIKVLTCKLSSMYGIEQIDYSSGLGSDKWHALNTIQYSIET